MTRVKRSATVTTVASLLLLAGGERASGQVELSLHGGLYTPLADIVVTEFGGFGSIAPKELGRRQRAAVAVGGRLTVWLSRRLGLEAAALFTPSNLTRDLPFGPPVETETSITLATARAVWRPGDPARPVTYHLLAGLGFVARSGPAFEIREIALQGLSRHIAGATDPALVLGAGLRARLSPRIDFRIDVEDYAYWPDLAIVTVFPAGDGTVAESRDELDTRFANDLVTLLGLEFRL